jgi:RNA polymerase sigma-70 factor (ECF subfamily)
VGHKERDRQAGFEAEMLPLLDAAYRLARGLTGNEQDAEDLVQETYLRAFRGFGRYLQGTNARAWLFTIMRRAFINSRSTVHSRQRFSRVDTEEGAVDVPDVRTPGPEEQSISAEEREEIFAALAGMPEVYRTVLALVDLGGMRYAEAAQVLECPEGTVMSRLSRARRELARRLQGSIYWSEKNE